MPTCTGAIQVRRSRPAPKWAMPLAVVFVLVGGEAAWQLTPDGTFDSNGLKVDVAARVTEGASTTIGVTLKASVAANTATATDVTVTVQAESHGTPPTRMPTSATTTPDAEDETVVLRIEASDGLSISDEPLQQVTIDDDETQSYVVALALGAAPRESAAAFDLVVSADPVHVDDEKTLTLQIDDRDYVLDTDADEPGNQISDTLDSATTSFTAKVTPPTNDGDRADDAVTVKVYSGTVGNATEEDALTFTVADAHALPVPAAVTVEVRDTTGRPATAVPEGGAVDLTISVDRGTGCRGHDRRGPVGGAGVGAGRPGPGVDLPHLADERRPAGRDDPRRQAVDYSSIARRPTPLVELVVLLKRLLDAASRRIDDPPDAEPGPDSRTVHGRHGLRGRAQGPRDPQGRLAEGQQDRRCA